MHGPWEECEPVIVFEGLDLSASPLNSDTFRSDTGCVSIVSAHFAALLWTTSTLFISWLVSVI